MKRFKMIAVLLSAAAVLHGGVLKTDAMESSHKSVDTKAAVSEEAEQKTTFPVHVIQKAGDDNENFVIAIMGDGYTLDQQDKFVEDATKRAQGMLQWSPYKDYSDRINIYAVQVVSNESGISYDDVSLDTYFHIKAYGKAPQFTKDGAEKAKSLRKELETEYLDAGGYIGTIHILSNYNGNLGASNNALFSFSAASSDSAGGDAMAHEIAHSIGGLGDEYGRIEKGQNISTTTDAETIKWRKLLGFRGIGITQAGTTSVFAPGRVCMMRNRGEEFCEVCKMELSRKLNNSDYTQRPKSIYVADPEISIPHDQTGTLDRDSEKYRISEANISKANGKDLEFRTVVQNIAAYEQNLKISLRITGADGSLKYQQEKEYTVPALSNWYDPEAARESLSVVLPNVSDLRSGDHFEGKVIDTASGEVLATDKTAEQAWSTINISYQLKAQDGAQKSVPHTGTSVIHVPKGSVYTIRKPKLAGYTFVGSSVGQDEILVSEAKQDIIYYYEIEQNQQKPVIPVVSLTVVPEKMDKVTLTTTVTGEGKLIPQGSVEFYVDGKAVGTKELDAAGLAKMIVCEHFTAGEHTANARFFPKDATLYEQASSENQTFMIQAPNLEEDTSKPDDTENDNGKDDDTKEDNTGGNQEGKDNISIKLNKTSLKLEYKKTARLTAAVVPAVAGNTSVSWSSDNNKVASVDKNGKVTAKKNGTARITAKAGNGKTAVCKVTVKSSIKLNRKSMALQNKKSSTTLKIASKSAPKDAVASVKSSNTKVLKVSLKGSKIKMNAQKKTGTAKVTVTMKSGAKATCKVTVTSITLKESKGTIKVGKSLTIKVKGTYPKKEKVSFKSSNKKVAKVDRKGRVTGKKAGKATLTVTTKSGAKAVYKVTVKK